MASVRIGGARVDITGQSASLEKAMRRASAAYDRQERDLKRLRRQAQRTTKAYAALGKGAAGLTSLVGAGAIAAGLKAAVADATAFSTMLVEASRNTGILETRLEAIAHVFAQDGIGFSATITSLATFQKRISEVGDGLATYVRSFDKLGLSYERLRKLAPEDQFYSLVEAIAAVEDQTTRQQVAQDLLGRAGKQLVGTIVRLRGGWRDAVDASDALTRATAGQHRKAKELTGELEVLKQRSRDVAVQLSADNAEGIEYWTKKFSDLKVVALQAAAALGKALATFEDAPAPAQSITEQRSAKLVELAKARLDLAKATVAFDENPLSERLQQVWEKNLALVRKLKNEVLELRGLSGPPAPVRVEADTYGTASTEAQFHTDPYGPLGLEAAFADAPGRSAQRGRELLEALTAARERDAEAAKASADAERAWAHEVEAARRRLLEGNAFGGGRGGDPRALANQARLQAWEDERVAHEAAVSARLEVERAASEEVFRQAEMVRDAQVAAARDAQRAWETMATSIGDHFANAFGQFASGSAKAGDAFRSFAAGVIQEMIRIQAQAAAARILSFLGGLFFGGGAPSGWIPTGGGNAIGGYGIPGARQGGGPVAAGRAYTVGEAGPEVFVPDRAGRIIPNHRMGGAGAAPSINLTIQGVNDPTAIRAEVFRLIPVLEQLQDSRFYKRMMYPNQQRTAMRLGVLRG